MTEENKKRRGRKPKNPLDEKQVWTVKELQMWVSMATSMQGADWVPDANQWEMVKTMIFKLQAEAPRPPQQQRPRQPPQPGPYGHQPQQQPMDLEAILQQQNQSVVLPNVEMPADAMLTPTELQRRANGGVDPNARDPVTGDKIMPVTGFI
jgi:hypothetical protein